MKPPEDKHGEECDRGNEYVIGSRRVEIYAADHRTPDSPKAIFAPRHGRPSERDSVKHRRERKRQQREINTTPAQDKRTEQRRDQGDQTDTDQDRHKKAAGKKF